MLLFGFVAISYKVAAWVISCKKTAPFRPPSVLSRILFSLGTKRPNGFCPYLSLASSILRILLASRTVLVACRGCMFTTSVAVEPTYFINFLATLASRLSLTVFASASKAPRVSPAFILAITESCRGISIASAALVEPNIGAVREVSIIRAASLGSTSMSLTCIRYLSLSPACTRTSGAPSNSCLAKSFALARLRFGFSSRS